MQPKYRGQVGAQERPEAKVNPVTSPHHNSKFPRYVGSYLRTLSCWKVLNNPLIEQGKPGMKIKRTLTGTWSPTTVLDLSLSTFAP